MKRPPVLLLAVRASCSDDDPVRPSKEPHFEGTDRCIISFSLTEYGITYNAAIAGDSITVTVPADVSFGFSRPTSAEPVIVQYRNELRDYSKFAGIIPALSGNTWNVVGCAYEPTWQGMTDGRYSE